MTIINTLPRWEKQKLQEKTVTAGTSAITVVPDDKFALSQVTINPTPSEAKTITPSITAQTVVPPTGKLYNQVTVNAMNPKISGFSSIANVYNGESNAASYTFTSAKSNVLVVGSSGRSGSAKCELSTTATITAQLKGQTTNATGYQHIIFLKTVNSGDVVRVSSGYGYPSIFIYQLTFN